MNVVGSRVDALTLAYRVQLDPAFVAALRARAEISKLHGRATFEWLVRAPEDDGDGTVSSFRRVGPLRMRWADEAERTQIVSKVWGELRFSKATKVWNLVNEPFYRLHIDLNAPGGGAHRDCPACKGLGRIGRSETCGVCDGEGFDEEPGWTLEIVWYAQTLADWGLDLVLRESAALASMCGEVLETRLRRIDLCADVSGWEVRGEDVKRLAKRSRAKWAVHDDGIDEPAEVHGTGAMSSRRVTGISVGRGGALMSRIYDKRAELEHDAIRREREEDRWRAAGWDGIAPVTRVEFQVRGVALTEMGLRDPDACLEAVTRTEEYLDSRGYRRRRKVVTGHRVLTATEDGREVQATLVHRLDAIWNTCVNWVRLVAPAVTKSGNAIPVSRLQDDPRWKLLRGVTFAGVRGATPIRRWRPRSAASAAQALGVALSAAGRDQRLQPMSENPLDYENEVAAAELLRERVFALKAYEAETVFHWLLDRWGGPTEANVHFAVRANAARLRFWQGVLDADLEASLAPRDGPRDHEAPRGDWDVAGRGFAESRALS